MNTEEDNRDFSNDNPLKSILIKFFTIFGIPLGMVGGSTLGIVVAPEGLEVAGAIFGGIAPLVVGSGLVLADGIRSRNNNN